MNEVVVDVQNLSVQFGAFFAVNNISFSVKRGEIFGFLGANGAGKTTTIRVLCGLLNPSLGRVFVNGIPYLTESDGTNIKKNVGYMSQKFTLYNDLTIEENFSFLARLRNLNSKFYLERKLFLLDFIQFNRSLSTFVRDLPGGIKQQVALAAALLADPDIIFLDEPTSGVTPLMRARFWELIQTLSKLKKTVFVTTHYMDEAEQCERVALMKTGQIVALDTPFRLKETTFPNPLFEFTPHHPMNYHEIDALKKQDLFDFFEPYGQRFHASFKPNIAQETEINALRKQFEIQTLKPSLEDVFIKIMEGSG